MKTRKTLTKLFDFDDLSIDEALDWVSDKAKADEFAYIVTPNIDHTQRLINSEDSLRLLYENADLCLCDSRILRLMLKLKGYHLRYVVPGSDLTARLFDSGILRGLKIVIVGGEQAVFSKLKGEYKDLELIHVNPSMGFINKPDEVVALRATLATYEANIIFLAIGSPQQEKFAHLLKQDLKQGVALCVGASILFITGEEKRAPSIFQTLHLEWLFRMISTPRLLKRYWQNFCSLRLIYKAL